VTAPRFLGYSFNPVSFWYIYDQFDSLTMMILEVNNTFDERRLYLVKASENPSSDRDLQLRLKHHWAKDFHVSPFNSRKGTYSFTASNPYSKGQYQYPGIDNNIVLVSSKNHSKLVTRLFSDDSPISSQEVGPSDNIALIFQWCWLGLFTFPRILKEASLLFFWRHLHVWLRPEVQKTSIGRRATAAERSVSGLGKF
jgi:uncharacterized protein DUF1365